MPYDRKAKMKALLEDWRDCQRCPLAQERTCLVFGSGSPDAEILVIGEGPGREEDADGVPFIGESGQILDHLLKLGGEHTQRKKLFITNMICCRATTEEEVNGKVKKKDRAPSRTEIKACWPRLSALIRIVDPLVILAVGKTSACTLTGLKNQTSALRDIFPAVIPGAETAITYPVISIYHPAYLARRGNNADLFQSTVDQLKLLNRTVDAFHALGRDLPWKENKDEQG